MAAFLKPRLHRSASSRTVLGPLAQLPSLALLPLLLLLLVACGSDAGEEMEDAQGTAGADRPVAGALPDDSAGLAAAPRPGSPDTAADVGSAVPGDPGRTPGEASSGPDTLTGVVGTVGAEPLVQFVLQLDDGRVVTLGDAGGTTRPEAIPDHPLAELARLTGARVRVMGEAEAFPAVQGRGFAVDAYELLAVEGVRPITGTLVRGDPGARTPDRLEADRGASRSWILVGMPSNTPATGSVVWVIGTERGDSLLVEGYGVLRPSRR